MSKHALDDFEMGMPGYFLPEESRHRLVSLSEHIKFLSRLAQPRIADEEKEWAPEVRMGQLAFCLELLSDQVDLVLDEISWPAERATADAADGDADEESEQEGSERNASEEPADEEAADVPYADRFAFGVTPAQFDALDHLIQTISAQGDVVATGDSAGFADNTLTMMGRAIFDTAQALGKILDQVEAQTLRKSAGRSGVAEECAIYTAGRAEPSYNAHLH